jgi:hypothetical protein
MALQGLVGAKFVAISAPGLTDHLIAEILFVVTDRETLKVQANLLEFEAHEKRDDGCEITVEISERSLAERYFGSASHNSPNSGHTIKGIQIIRHFIKGIKVSDVVLDYVTDVGIHVEFEHGSIGIIKTSYHDELLAVSYDTKISELSAVGSRYRDSNTERFETTVECLTLDEAMSQD